MCALTEIKKPVLNRQRAPAAPDQHCEDPNLTLREIVRKMLNSSTVEPIENDTILYKVDENIVTLKDLPEEQQNFYHAHVAISTQSAIHLCAQTVFQACSTWKAARKIRLTASSGYNLYTYVKNKSPDWASKISRHLQDSFSGNSATVHGTKNEPKARELYINCTGRNVICLGFLVDPNLPWFGYSPDGIVDGECIIEVKCPVSGKKNTILNVVAELSYLKKRSKTNANIPIEDLQVMHLSEKKNGKLVTLTNVVGFKENHKYYFQAQMGMLITGLRRCDFIVYAPFDDTAIVIPIFFNEDMVFEYLRQLQFVYFHYLLPKIAVD